MISTLVGAHGLFILATTLLDQLAIHRGQHLINSLVIDIPLLIGVSLLYLASLLSRRKYTAWLVGVMAYIFYLGINVLPLLGIVRLHHLALIHVVRAVVLPIGVLSLLLVFRHDFVVRSDRQGFKSASRFSLIVLLAAFIYGTAGFALLDRTDFHQEITIGSAAHYTIDQFDLTTNHPVTPVTRRAHVFVDSLSFVSTAAVIYAVIALFQPLRLRLIDQSSNRELLRKLLEQYGAPSEDYFKLWPHDKQYYFDDDQCCGLAYHVWRGVALCLGDPAGNSRHYGELLDTFSEVCYQNDWLPTFVHIQDGHRKLYENRGYTLQKLGQEAVIDLEHFESEVGRNKYFRHIRNKFTKQGYTAELLLPPHHGAVVNRLRDISNDWLERGGRVERGFAMGYFSDEYMQACPIMVVRDAAGTIQAFVNQLPANFDKEEATYDLLRNTQSSLGNITDFLLLHFIARLRADGYSRLNLGLCPLTGLDESDADERTGLIHNLLRFTFANGDRLYSFSGLYRFKAKYEPEWRDRFVAYRGGIRGFSRSMTALTRTMRIKK
jgi:phosphatidylglycerol lysyltransferase